jgi:hypothetical protein
MKKNKPEYWGKLMALWVKSCTDKQPIMFYKSCKANLKFQSESAVKEMVEDNRELFWPISEQILQLYKDHYTESPDKFPQILVPENEHRDRIIENLDINCAFTSQFRRKPDEHISPDEIREWGLKYIEKKWKLELESRKEIHRIWATIVIPFLMFIIALAALFIKSK